MINITTIHIHCHFVLMHCFMHENKEQLTLKQNTDITDADMLQGVNVYISFFS